MRKEELRRLRALPATKEMMFKGRQFQEIEEETWWNHKKRKVIMPEYDVLFRVQNLSGYIKVAVFLPEDIRKDIKNPRYEIFLNVEGEEYITRELDQDGKEVRWLSSMLENLPEVPRFGYWSNTKYFIGNDGMRTLNNLKLEHDSPKPSRGGYRLQKWQQEQKDKETKRKEDKEQKPWDEDMALIPKIMPGFKEWMRKEAAEQYYMIYEYDSRGAKTGYCSRCKRVVPISGAKHGEKTKCQACGVESIFKASGKIRTLSTGTYYGEVIQKFKGGIVIREFEQRQWYRNRDYRDPYVRTEEYERIMIFDNGVIRRYKWDSYKNKYNRWILDKGYMPIDKRTYYWQTRIKLYKKNLSSLKRNTLLKRSAIDLWPDLPVSTTVYIAMEQGNPAIEMLARIGMFRLAKGIMKEPYDKTLLKQNETEIAKMLKIDRSRLKRLTSMDANVNMLRWMQLEKVANTIWPDEMIKDFGEANILPSSFGFLKIKLSFVQCYNYLMKQAKLMDETLQQALITWRDYLCMAEQLKMNVKNEQIAKPKDVKRAHDEAILNSQRGNLRKKAKAIEKKWPKVNEQLAKLKKYEFAFGEYAIVAPKEVLDIVIEGTVLNHCVHTCDYYFERIQKDESYLFFLRRSCQLDVPWYTLEVEPSGNIRQKRTTGDNQNADFQKAIKFLEKWQQYFRKQLTEEEKQLGEKSNKLRIENYANLRKNGNKIWHGKLAGQLLADVLEQDFMEATV